MTNAEKRNFYTPIDLSRFLISLLSDENYLEAVDICCGEWNLIKAASERWPNLIITGIDIDGNSALTKPNNANYKNIDGRQFVLECIDNNIKYSLVLANPPFEKCKRVFVGEQKKKINRNFMEINNNRLDVEMMIANAELVKLGGTLLAIVPSSFIDGQTYKSIRQAFFRLFTFERIIHLPLNTFKFGEINSYAIFLKRKIEKDDKGYLIKCYDAVCEDNKWTSQNEHTMNFIEMVNGYCVPKCHIDNTEKILTYRGKINSSIFIKKPGVPVIHICRQNAGWDIGKKYISRLISNKHKYPSARTGDIVLCRVGKGAGHWFEYNHEEMLISDCVIVLRTDNTLRTKEILNTYSIDGCLKHLVKGISTRYITESDLRGWLNAVLQ